jgi:hypothetical protein
MEEVKEYRIGEGKMPCWCKKVLMPFKKLDGYTGYELMTYKHTIALNEGDLIIKKDGKFSFERQVKEDEFES